MSKTNLEKSIVVAQVIIALLSVSAIVAMMWVMVHFIRKWW